MIFFFILPFRIFLHVFFQMISRRILRIKVVQILYAYYTADLKDIRKAEKELQFSVNKSFELYQLLLLSILEIRDYAVSRIELAKNKLRPSYEDINPNEKFINNALINQLAVNNNLNKYCRDTGISWVQYPELIKNLYNGLVKTEYYINYMKSENTSYDEDKKIVLYIYSELIAENEDLPQILEEMSIYWNDDMDYIISMIIKTIKSFKESDGAEKKLMSVFKNEEDKDFLIRLYRQSIINQEFSLKLIQETANNWDVERIAFLDTLIMQMAITEFIEFQSIPTKVTLNEYLDIAKYYSTEKSNSFINGILDKILITLRNENKIKKTGRGLIGEN